MFFILITVLTYISATIGTISGFGLSTIMVPILILFYPLPATLLLVGIIHLFSDIWKVVLFKKGVNLELALAFGIPGLIAAVFGAKLILLFPENTIKQAIGIFLILYVLFLFVKPKFKLARTRSNTLIGGVSYGLLAGISGIGGTIRSTFLSSFNLKKAVYIATGGAIGFFVDTARIITYYQSGVRLPIFLVLYLVILIPISYLAGITARTFVDRIPQHLFRQVVAIFLLIIGIKLTLNI